MAQNPRKSTQRERLLSGMVAATNRRGYAGATVSAVIAEAGVSRPTFYDYFADRDDCLQAAIEDVQQELLAAITQELAQRPANEALAGAVAALVAYASAEPAKAGFLLSESMAGGTRALDQRDRGIAKLAAAIERAQRGASADQRVADLDPRVALGGVYRIIGTRLRRGEQAVSKLNDELLAWVASYERAAGERRWQKLSPGPVPERSPHLPDAPIHQAPALFPAGRPRLSEAEIAENHRLRILYATAQLAVEKGYPATTVADITRSASVDGRAFYRHFSDKQEAFTAVHELGFQQVMDVTAKAFFSVEGWPQRSWEAGRALTQLLQENPLVARVGFVEAYAVGASAVQRIEDSHTAFVFFLQEGLLQQPKDSVPPSRVAMEAIIAAVFETIYLQVRAGAESQLPAMLGQIEHLWLTPFLGVAEADAFIERQQRASKARKRSRAGASDGG
jgi:AcrR family transcriptional regulator